MSRKNYYKKKGGWSTYIKWTERISVKRKCNCYKQLCKGYFIPHIEGQRNCIFDARDNGFTIILPDEEFRLSHKK